MTAFFRLSSARIAGAVALFASVWFSSALLMAAPAGDTLFGRSRNASLSAEALAIWSAALLFFLLLVQSHRLLKLDAHIPIADHDWLYHRLLFVAPITGLIFAIQALGALDLGIWQTFKAGSSFFPNNLPYSPLTQFLAARAELTGALSFLFFTGLCALAFCMAMAAISYAAFLFTRNRHAAFLASLLYAFFRFHGSPDGDPLSLSLGDAAFSACFLILPQQLYGETNTPRLWLLAPLGACAAWSHPAYTFTGFLLMLFILIEAKDRERCFSFPPVWITPIFVVLASSPILQHLLRSFDASTFTVSSDPSALALSFLGAPSLALLLGTAALLRLATRSFGLTLFALLSVLVIEGTALLFPSSMPLKAMFPAAPPTLLAALGIEKLFTHLELSGRPGLCAIFVSSAILLLLAPAALHFVLAL